MSDDNAEQQTTSAADNTEAAEQTQENSTATESTEAAATESTDSEQQEDGDTSDKKKKTPNWAQKRINVLAAEKNQAREEAHESKKQVETLLAELAAARSKAATEGDATKLPLTEIERLAHIKAEEIASKKLDKIRSDDVADRVWNQGIKEYSDFGETIQNLNDAFGDRFASSAPIIMEALDNPHKIMHHLGENLDEAARILSLSPAKQIAELTKLEASLVTKAKPISKASPPIKTIDGKGKAEPTLDNEKLSTSEWMKVRYQDLDKKGKRRF